MQTRYRLTGRLETGELAELYEAIRDERDRVLIKLFHPKTSDQRYARVVADAQLKLAQVPSEGVLRILDLGTVRGRLAIVREYVDGYTLGQALQRLTTREVLMPPAVALYVIVQLLESVHRAHELALVHGAITPGNVLIGKDGRTAMGDFGALAALQAVPELRPFAAKGRGAYRAPEVVAQGELSVASDVYSLGAIAYELLTLKEAARATKTVSTRHEPLPPPSRLDRRINARLDPVVMRALELSPQRRFKSCAEFAQSLRNFLSASGGMPGRAELAKVVRDLFPNEVQLQLNPQVPIAEPFALDEVTGVDVSSFSEASMVLAARPSFSGGALEQGTPAGAETIEAMPSFSDYGTESTHVPSNRPAQEPDFSEGTAPGAAGPLESGWEAPPGQAPVKKPALGAAPVVGSGMSAALKRVRMVDDLSVPSDTVEVERPAPPSVRRRKVTPPPVSAEGPSTESSAGIPRPMLTEERAIHALETRRRRFLAIAVGVALVGLFCFGLVIYRFMPKEETLPPLQISQTPPPATPIQPPAPAAVETEKPSSETPVLIQPEPEEIKYTSPKRGFAYLSVKASEKARVFIDGRRVPGQTPILRFKVEPGTRKIEVESVRTGERKEVSRRFVKGKTVSLYEFFDSRGR